VGLGRYELVEARYFAELYTWNLDEKRLVDDREEVRRRGNSDSIFGIHLPNTFERVRISPILSQT
jgi:hypothetical protein